MKSGCDQGRAGAIRLLGRSELWTAEAHVGLMDKVKAQATVLAQKTQETARDSKV